MFNDTQTNQEEITPKGKLTITVTNPQGEIVEKREATNLVVTTGKYWIANRLKTIGNTVPAEMSHMGIGTGTVDPVVGNSALGAQVQRNTVTSTVSPTSNIIEYTATFSPGEPSSNVAITEAGIFNAASGGTMLCRTIFGEVNKTTADTMTIVWAITVV